MKKRILSLAVTLCMALSLLTGAAFAADMITLDKTVYLPGETMSIQLSGNFPDGAQVMIYKDTARIGQWSDYHYIKDLDTTNIWKVDAPEELGTYQVRVYGSYPYTDEEAAQHLMGTKAFTVGYNTQTTTPTTTTTTPTTTTPTTTTPTTTTPTTTTTTTTPGTTATGTGMIALDKPAYTINEPMTVTLSGTFPDGAQVMIYKDTAKITQWETYQYIKDLDSTNVWKIDAPEDIGSYQVRVYGSYPYTEADAVHLMATKDFTVAYNTTGKPGVTLNKTSYAADEQMSITATGLSQVQIDSSAMLMIYAQNAKQDQWENYQYVKDLDITNTWKTEAPYETGIYEVRLYAGYASQLTDPVSGLLAKATFAVGDAVVPSQPVTGSVTVGQNGASSWAVPEINTALQEGLVTDKVTVDFSRPITREEFCELAVKLYEAISGKTATAAPADTFADTQNSEILKAYALGITSGTDMAKKLFSPNNPVTRQEIATFLLRTVKAAVPALDTSAPNAPVFVDAADIDAWALEGVNYFASKDIIKGANGAFMPKAGCTCESAILLVQRAFASFSAI